MGDAKESHCFGLGIQSRSSGALTNNRSLPSNRPRTDTSELSNPGRLAASAQGVLNGLEDQRQEPYVAFREVPSRLFQALNGLKWCNAQNVQLGEKLLDERDCNRKGQTSLIADETRLVLVRSGRNADSIPGAGTSGVRRSERGRVPGIWSIREYV